MAHIIVVGNEKGGSGKSTTCMHVGTALARMGFRVGALDLDLRQRSEACPARGIDHLARGFFRLEPPAQPLCLGARQRGFERAPPAFGDGVGHARLREWRAQPGRVA